MRHTLKLTRTRRYFSEGDREEIVGALRDARAPDPNGMTDQIEEVLYPVYMIVGFDQIITALKPPLPNFIRTQRQLLKARALFRVIAAYLEFDRRTYRWLNNALDSRGEGNALDQVAGARAFLDKFAKLNLHSKSRGRPHDDGMGALYSQLRRLVSEIFEGHGVALRIGDPESSGIGVLRAVLHALTGRRPTHDALCKRLRRMQRPRTK
jgi:hypothetical protein